MASLSVLVSQGREEMGLKMDQNALGRVSVICRWEPLHKFFKMNSKVSFDVNRADIPSVQKSFRLLGTKSGEAFVISLISKRILVRGRPGVSGYTGGESKWSGSLGR